MNPSNPFPNIQMSSPDLTSADREAVDGVMQTTALSMGPQIDLFEQSFRERFGVKYAIGVNSGTAGLHLCVRAVDIQPGDLVITTPFSFVASTNVILYEHAIPVYVDVDPQTGNILPDQVFEAAHDLVSSNKLARRWLPRKGAEHVGALKAILPVDVFGQPADMDEIHKIASGFDLKVIEDSCEALGAEYKGKPAGTLGDYGVFGFYPNKQITTGEGGLILTNHAEEAVLMQALRNQGRAPGDTWLSHTYLGYNYRMDEMSAALGNTQLKRLEQVMQTRQQVADWYSERLVEIPQIEPPAVESTTTRNSWFVYVIKLHSGIDRQKLAQKLAEDHIPVRPYFLPIHLQPYLVERFGYQPGDFPITEDLGSRGLALPFSGIMTEEEVEYVCHRLHQALLTS